LSVNVEIADTPELLSKGLMFRKSLDKDAGMLFKFPDVIYASFWGANTYIPLDLAFITTDGTISGIENIVPLSTKGIYASFPCKYALEVNSGFFKENEIDVGSKIKINEDEKKVLFE